MSYKSKKVTFLVTFLVICHFYPSDFGVSIHFPLTYSRLNFFYRFLYRDFVHKSIFHPLFFGK